MLYGAANTYTGSADALKSLLQANAHQAFLYAISTFRPNESNTLRAAFSRALRAISVAIAETVGPSQWGIGLQEHPEDVQNEARMALDFLFEVWSLHSDSPIRLKESQIRALDIFLPLLEDPSPQVNTSIAQLLSSTVRTEYHRLSVSEWLPPHERNKEVKGKRGWEKAGPANSPARQGGWVVRRLVILISRRDVKVRFILDGSIHRVRVHLPWDGRFRCRKPHCLRWHQFLRITRPWPRSLWGRLMTNCVSAATL